MIYGLRKLPRDRRDLKLGALVTLPKLTDLPDEYYLPGTFDFNYDQKNSDFCTGTASSFASYLQEKVKLSFEWVFAVGKWLEGRDVDSFGLDIRQVMKVHQKYGAPEVKDVPFSLENKDPYFLRRKENYPDLFMQALWHKKSAYTEASSPQYDFYDSIKASIWSYRNEKRAVVTGVNWEWSPMDKILKLIKGQGSGHCMTVCGWSKDGLYYKNSYGEVGYKGGHYVTRETVNKYAKLYGAFMFIDMPQDVLNELIKNQKISIITKMIDLLKEWLDILLKKT